MIKIKSLSLIFCVLSFMSCGSCAGDNDVPPEEPTDEALRPPLKVGYSLAISKFSLEKLKHAKAAGISYVEASGIGLFVDEQRNFKLSDQEIIDILTVVRKAADEAGIDVWSIHMPFGQYIDISLVNDVDRLEVVAMHKKLLGFLRILGPEIILFHPSYYLGLNERDLRKSQMIKSALELNEAVRQIGADMVIENMLGPELLASGGRERPLMRTVEETQALFQRLPASIYSAIDMNHIKNPESLIRAMGPRLKTVHIADGSGAAENHYFPCSGEGSNNWTEIFAALDEVAYDGPFMYESAFKDEADLVQCYHSLFADYVKSH